jgi:hypothetical protein
MSYAFIFSSVRLGWKKKFPIVLLTGCGILCPNSLLHLIDRLDRYVSVLSKTHAYRNNYSEDKYYFVMKYIFYMIVR